MSALSYCEHEQNSKERPCAAQTLTLWEKQHISELVTSNGRGPLARPPR